MQTSIHRTALTTISLLFLLSGATAAVADEGGHHVNTQTQTLNATMTGGVANFGTQTYKVNGGQVAFAMVGGQVVDPSSATIKYTLQATQDGLTTRGSARVQFTGTTVTGVAVGMSGRFTINTIVPAAELPLGCSTNCQSALPYLFVASAPDVQMTIGGITQTIPQTLQIESPYFNPWGAPIVLAFA